MSTEPKYYFDYPSRPIGGGNPYHCCVFCLRSAPDINGRLERHESHCLYRRVKVSPSDQLAEELLQYDESERHYYEIRALLLEMLVEDLGWSKEDATDLVWA
jgi:hypothetical protein